MPRIPEFRRQRLVSSVVGVVRPDKGESVLAGVAGITNVFLGASVANDRAKLKAEKELRTASNQVGTGRAAVQLGADFEPVTQTARSSAEFLTATDDIIQSQSALFTGPEARTMFQKKAVAVQKRSLDLFQSRNEKRRITSIEDNTNGTIEDIAQNVGNVFSSPTTSFDDKLQEFSMNLEMANQAIATSSRFLDPTTITGFREDSTQAITTAAVVGLLDGDPSRVDEFLTDVVGSAILTTAEEADVRKAATDLIAKRDAFAKVQKTRAISKTENDFTEQALDGTLDPVALTVAQAQGAISPGFAKDVMAVFTSAKAASPTTRADTVLSLTAAISFLPFEKKRGKRVIKGEEVTLGEIGLIRKRILDAHANGDVTSADGRNLLSMITPAFNEDIAAMVTDLNSKLVAGASAWFSPIDRFTGAVGAPERWLETPQEIAQAKAAMSTLFMQRIGEMERQKGSRLSVQESHILAAKIRDDFLLSVESDKALLELGQITQHPNFGFVRVVGFYPNGEAILNDDLSAPVQKALNGDSKPK